MLRSISGKRLIAFVLLYLGYGLLWTGPAHAQSSSSVVPPDFSQRHKPPIILAIDGISVPASVLTVDRRVAYLGPDLMGSASVKSMKAEVKTFAWSGDLAQTLPTIEDVKRSVLDAAQVATNDSRSFAIVAHSWGGILAHRALRELEETKQIGAGVVDILITIHTPLNTPAPNPNVAGLAFGAQSMLNALVKAYVGDKLWRPAAVKAWSNYYSDTDWISSVIPIATDNINTRADHKGSHTNPSLLDQYGVEIALAATKLARANPQAAQVLDAARYTLLNRHGAKWVFNTRIISPGQVADRKLSITNEGDTVVDGTNVTRIVRRRTLPDGNEYLAEALYFSASLEGILLIGRDELAPGRTKWRFQPPRLILKEPVTVGAVWEYNGAVDVDGKIHKYPVRTEVQRREQVVVPAGTFEAIKVVIKVVTNSGTTTKTEWLAKDVGIVRREHFMVGKELRTIDELAEYSTSREAGGSTKTEAPGRGQATAQTLEELQRKRIQDQESADRRRKEREDISERVRSQFMSVGYDLIRDLKHGGLRFKQLGDRDLDAYRFAVRAPMSFDWPRCGAGKEEILQFANNPFATKCNGFIFQPEGTLNFVDLHVTAVTGALLADGTFLLFTEADFVEKAIPACRAVIKSGNAQLTYTFPCEQNPFTAMREQIRKLLDQSVRSALSGR